VGATKLPDGQITQKSVQPLLKKYSAFAVGQIISTTPAILSRRGALAIVTNVGTGCGGRGSIGRDVIAGRDEPRERSNGVLDERCCSGR
jgi:hypothetical protein